MTVDNILDIYFGEFEIYDGDNNCIIYDSCENSFDGLNHYYYESVSSLDVENSKLIIFI